MQCYELTLTENYVLDWDFQNAIRELIQNGIDQTAVNPQCEFSIEYNYDKRSIILKNKKSHLRINSLLLGRTSKVNNKDTVGQFGEGYKIAALVLNRLGKTFTIFNNEKNEVWTTRFKNSEKWKEKILAFYIEKIGTDESDLVIEIGNVSQSEYWGLENIWLGFSDEYKKAVTKYGEILLDEDYAGKVYVNGLAVGYTGNLTYGYNFKPQYISLERDRKTCDSWRADDLASQMIAEAMINEDITIEDVKTLIEKEVDDIRLLEFNGGSSGVNEIKEALIEAFDNQNPEPNSIPVNTQEQINKVRAYGGTPIVVPSKVASLLKSETEIRIEALSKQPMSQALTMKQKFRRWYDIYSCQLKDSAKRDFLDILDLMET